METNIRIGQIILACIAVANILVGMYYEMILYATGLLVMVLFPPILLNCYIVKTEKGFDGKKQSKDEIIIYFLLAAHTIGLCFIMLEFWMI